MNLLAFFSVIKAATDHLALYPPGNPAVQRKFEDFKKALPSMVQGRSQLEIEIREGMVIVNDEPLGEQLLKSTIMSWFQRVCYERHLFRIVISSMATVKDLQALASVLGKPASNFRSSATAADLVRQSGVVNVSVNESRSPVSGTQPASDAGARTPAVPSVAATVNVETFLAEEEAETLARSIQSLLMKNEMGKVAEALNLICQDLYSADRADRELGVSSYKVVARALMKGRHEKALYQITRNMAQDLDQIQESDIFEIHLNTFGECLRFFLNVLRPAPLIMGLEWAGRRMIQADMEKRGLVASFISRLVDEKCVTILIRQVEAHTQLQSQVERLVTHLGSAFLPSFLNVLFTSEERQLRHGLLNLLAVMGPVIYPDLMEQLKRAVSENKPWYVKRNLLQLLSSAPPSTLVPVLPDLLEDSSAKVVELAQRCVFSIQSKSAFHLGLDLLRQADEPTLIKLLGFVGAGRVKAFASTLHDILKSDVSEKVRLTAIAALGRLDTTEGMMILDEILSTTSLFAGKSQNSLRLAAAQALAQSRSEQARGMLTKYASDRNRAVRDYVNHVLDIH